MWVAPKGEGHGGFRYRRYGDGRLGGPNSDLNMLIVPMYGWLWRETGDERYLERGDAIFNDGARRAWLGGGKLFNQQYRNSFGYLRRREEGLKRWRDGSASKR